MNTLDVLLDGFGRAAEAVPSIVDGLSDEQLVQRPAPGANPIGWLVWHLARVEDEQVAEVARVLLGGERPTVWDDSWRDRFDLPYAPDAHGYGMDDAEVGQWRGTAWLLSGYYAAVHTATVAVLRELDAVGTDEQLDRIVDRHWDPPVTAGVRLVSVLDDVAQHIGQASYVKGLLGA